MAINMNKYDREYEAFQIFEQVYDTEASKPWQIEPRKIGPGQKDGNTDLDFQNEAPFYEIEYDSCPAPETDSAVLQSGRIKKQEKDEVREIFYQMRDIARENRFYCFNSSRFYDKKIRQENSKIFYKQGMFMKDFEDNCTKEVPLSAYFPNYQMMGYDQLRTYFTWRTRVREGTVGNTSLSYAFLYIYELLNLIGVDGQQDGLEQLMFFWEAFRVYDNTIDKYVPGWLKDYHIYYELPWSFKEFIGRNHLETYYPGLSDPENHFSFLCPISKYDIRKSHFYTEDRRELIKNCFQFTIDRLRQIFSENQMEFEDFLFRPAKKMTPWTPFKGALFYPRAGQRDRRIMLSEKEIYLCSGNLFTFNSLITAESGKRLVGYIMKQMESVLRRVTKYKYRISADDSILGQEMTERFCQAGISLGAAVEKSVLEFYQEASKTVVKIDKGALNRIRQEALQTQEKLIVPEAEYPANEKQSAKAGCSVEEKHSAEARYPVKEKQSPKVSALLQDPWIELKNALNETEKQALSILLYREADIRQFADQQGIMLEVLADGINEKAADFVGDSLLDGEFAIYEDYTEQVKEMVERG